MNESCKYCGRVLTASELADKRSYCYACHGKLPLVRKIKAEGEKIKEILAQREESSKKMTVEKFQKYKRFFDDYAHLPSCHTCRIESNCPYRPDPNRPVRINCPLWEK